MTILIAAGSAWALFGLIAFVVSIPRGLELVREDAQRYQTPPYVSLVGMLFVLWLCLLLGPIAFYKTRVQ